MKTLFRFQCEICDSVYDTIAEAERCEAQGLPSFSVVVGDIVLVKSGYGWYDGVPEWVENIKRLKNSTKGTGRKCPNGDTNCFSPCCTYQFYYVVTHTDRDPADGHRFRYHVYTEAMTGKQGYREGWTFDRGHVAPRVVPRAIPEKVREMARLLIGQKASHLL